MYPYQGLRVVVVKEKKGNDSDVKFLKNPNFTLLGGRERERKKEGEKASKRGKI